MGEMADVVRRELALSNSRGEEKVLDEKKVARLPVPDDAFVRQGSRLAGLYFRAIGVQ